MHFTQIVNTRYRGIIVLNFINLVSVCYTQHHLLKTIIEIYTIQYCDVLSK